MEFILDAFGASYVDRFTIEKCNVPSILLMEHAAQAVVKEIADRYDKTFVLCIAGKGNNGGDAVAVCRLLLELGFDAKCVLVMNSKTLCLQTGKIDFKQDNEGRNIKPEMLSGLVSDELYQQLEMLAGLGEMFEIVSDVSKLYEKYIKNGALPVVIVDGIFGTGFNKAPTGLYEEAISFINACHEKGSKVFAVDIPSGVNASNGKVPGVCIKADYTVTFGYKKIGQLLYPGRDYCGKLLLHEIGFSRKAIEEIVESEHVAFTLPSEHILKYMPGRRNDSNKGSYGKVLVVAGSDDMPGACTLATKTAYRCGCGLVTVCSSEKALKVLACTVPEAVLTEKSYMPDFSAFTSCLLGPGLGKSPDSRKLADDVISKAGFTGGLVIDADAINLLAEKMNEKGVTKPEERLVYINEYVPENTIFTPHKKELSRLFNISMEDLNELYEVAKWLAFRTDRIFVLKDAATIVAGKKKIYVNQTGNNGMSTAGSGDVLGGIIVSLLAQKTDLYTAACLGVCIHGLAGDYSRNRFSEYGVMAGDISDEAAKILKNLENAVMI
ncbi:MAG: NAD(P)H-hydrate dehydratase [Lachnospiraceae bacterium]